MWMVCELQNGEFYFKDKPHSARPQEFVCNEWLANTFRWMTPILNSRIGWKPGVSHLSVVRCL